MKNKILKLIYRNGVIIAPIVFSLLLLGAKYNILWLGELPYLLGYLIGSLFALVN